MIDGWFESHEDVGFTISHPKTKAGHKTDIDMWSLNQDVKVFRESITYGKPSEEHIVELLNNMYDEIKRIETTNRLRNSQ